MYAATAALFGYRRRFTEVMYLQIYAGPSYLRQPGGAAYMPVARIDLEAATPTSGLHVTLLHDLVLGPSHGGPLVGDLAEVAVSGVLVGPIAGHLRGGIYRNQLPGVADLGIVGYSAGAGLDLRVGRAWTMSAIAVRDARLNGDPAEHNIDRDVVQMRLTWEMPRDW
jgi:hypothetical protein